MKKLWFLIAMPLMMGALACKDDDDPARQNESEPQTRREMLIAAAWQLEQGIIDPPVEVDILGTKITISNYWELMAAMNGGAVSNCQKDNLMFFKADSSVVLDEGAEKCDPLDPQTQDGGDWSLIDSDMRIRFSSFPFDPLQLERVLELDSVSARRLKMSMDYRYGSPLGDSSDHRVKLEFFNAK